MSAAEVEVVETTKKPGAYKPVIEITGATTEFKDGKLIVTIPDENFLEQAKKNDLTESDIKKVSKFHGEYLKGVVGVVKDQLNTGYATHKDATGFEATVYTGGISDVQLFGDKHTTHTVKGVDYKGTGFTIRQKTIIPGVKAAIAAAKADIFSKIQ